MPNTYEELMRALACLNNAMISADLHFKNEEKLTIELPNRDAWNILKRSIHMSMPHTVNPTIMNTDLPYGEFEFRNVKFTFKGVQYRGS